MNTQVKNGQMPMIRPGGDICEDSGKILLRLEMPGVRKDDLEISVENNELRISAARKSEYPNGTFLIRERREGNFHRVYTIDRSIDRNRISASMENGILTVTLEVQEAEKPRRIEVMAG